MVVYIVIGKLFDEFVILENSKLVHRSPRVDGNRENSFELKNQIAVLWEKIKLPLGTRNNLYLVDKELKKHPLAQERRAVFIMRQRQNFVGTLSKAIALPVQEKFYSCDKDWNLQEARDQKEFEQVSAETTKTYRSFFVCLAVLLLAASLSAAILYSLKAFIALGIISVMLSLAIYGKFFVYFKEATVEGGFSRGALVIGLLLLVFPLSIIYSCLFLLFSFCLGRPMPPFS